MFVKNQKFLVLGVSKSGYFAGKYILSNNTVCYFYEELKNSKVENALGELVSLGGIIVSRENIDEIIKEIDVLIVSPGVPINHEVAVKARDLGKRIMSELEFGLSVMTPPLVAITGTNGKTTTVNLINEIFKKAEIKCEMVGNIGIPVSSLVDKIERETVCIAEVSSFQLESSNEIKPHISCVLNISPDHLERHYTMENYIYLKKRLIKNQKESEYAVLNYDDETVKEFYRDTKAKIIWVSLYGKVDGAYRLDGKFYYKNEYVMDESELAIFGEHNSYNALFSVAVAKLMGVKNADIKRALKEFKGVPHRLEVVEKKGGIKFYNDSKSTNTASAITAVNMMTSPTVLILGGSEKGENYDLLFSAIKNSMVKHVILTGASKNNMLESASKNMIETLSVAPNFESAVKMSFMFAVEGDSVLLSPACASFDEFSSYEERGEKFKKLVESFN